MKKRSYFLWLTPAVLFCMFGLFFLSLVGYRFSALICFSLAALIGLYFLFWRFPCKTCRILRIVVTVLLIIGIILASITGFFIGSAAMGSEEDAPQYMIVLGAAVHGTVPSLSLRERMDAAYDYLVKNPDTICIVSGGQGSGEDISEAACMYQYLTQKGIAPDRILQEDQATSTAENIAYSMELIRRHTGEAPDTIGIVSSEYHLYRASLMARSQNLIAVGIPARTTWVSLRINYFLREIVGVWYYILFGG